MKQMRFPLRGRALIVGALALVPATTLTTPAFATDTLKQTISSVNYTCRIGTNVFDVPGLLIFEGDAPASVEPGADFKIVIKPPNNLPFHIFQTLDSQEIIEATEARLLIDLPTNATFHSAFLTGGSGFSGADLDEIDNGLLETIRGPIPGGGQFVFPALTIKVEADIPHAEIETIAGGTSFNTPGFELVLTVRDTGGNISSVTQTCFPDRKRALTTTRVDEHNNNNGNNHNNDWNNGWNNQNKPHKVHT